MSRQPGSFEQVCPRVALGRGTARAVDPGGKWSDARRRHYGRGAGRYRVAEPDIDPEWGPGDRRRERLHGRGAGECLLAQRADLPAVRGGLDRVSARLALPED